MFAMYIPGIYIYIYSGVFFSTENVSVTAVTCSFQGNLGWLVGLLVDWLDLCKIYRDQLTKTWRVSPYKDKFDLFRSEPAGNRVRRLRSQ